MTYRQIFNMSNMTGATIGIGTAYSTRVHPFFCGVRVVQSLHFCVVCGVCVVQSLHFCVVCGVQSLHFCVVFVDHSFFFRPL